MTEILISHPKDNAGAPDKTSYSYYEKASLLPLLHDGIKTENVTLDSHPLMCELFAGDGSFAKIFIDMGWNPKNITCFDMSKSRYPLVAGINWCYWYLQNLAKALASGDALSPEILAHSHRYHIVMNMHGGIDCDQIKLLSSFFAAPNAFILSG